MRLLGLSILYISAVFKSCSEPIIKDGDIVPINCQTAGEDIPVSQLETGLWSKWREDYIYPVKVCATVKGGKVGLCDPIIESKLKLQMRTIRQYLSVPLRPDDFIDSNTHCHVFKASQIANVLTDLTPVGLQPEAWLYGSQEPDKTATVQVSVRVAPYYFNKTGSIEAARGNNMLHAVVCNFTNCRITFEGSYKTKTKEYFRKEKGKFPQYVGVDGPVTGDMISVTSVECDTECPTKFIANDLITEAAQVAEIMTKSSRVMDKGLNHLNIGNVVVNGTVLVMEK